MGQMKNYRELIKELPSNQVICTFGEFHPPSAAHELQVKAVKKLAEEYGSDHLVLVSSSLKEDFLPAEKRVQYMNLMFPGTTIKVTGKSIEESLKELSRKYKSVVLVISEDLTENFQKILRKANLPSVEIILAGNTDPDSNKLCESAKKGDYTKFKKGLPSSLRELDGRRLMNDIRLNMGLEMVREEVKFSVNDLRDKYFKGEIYHIGEIVESDSNVYQIIKRGSNHLLLQSEEGVKVSKWIQDVKTSTREFMLKEGVMQPSGTDQVVPTATTSAVPVNGIKFKDFKNLLDKNKKPEIDLDNLDAGIDQENSVDKYADAAAQALSRAEPDRAGGLMHEPTSSVDNRHRRIKYHLGETHKLNDKVEIIKGSSKGIQGHIGEIRHGSYKGAPKTFTVYHGEHGAVQVRKEHIKSITEKTIDELTTHFLTQYKTAAAASAKAADSSGNYAKGDKRFKGIVKATNKQFDNDLKKPSQVKEDNGHYENAEEHLSKANDADAKGDKPSFHAHMADHHDEMSQWHESKGRSASADKHAEKADYHSEKAADLARGIKEAAYDKENVHAHMRTMDPDVFKRLYGKSKEEMRQRITSEATNYEVEPTNPNIKLRSGALKHHERGVKLDTEEGWEDHKMKDAKSPVWGAGTKSKEPLKGVDKVNVAGQEPHPEKWEEFKKKSVKEEQDQNFADLSEEDIDAMVESIQDEYDIINAYDDSELAIIDEETGEEILDEETIITEVLSRSERMRAKVRFAKTKSKRERSAKLALKRTSSTIVINKRARRLAINLMKKRLLRGRNASSLSVGEKERIESMIAKRKPILNRLAMKLSPRVRQIEKARLSHHKFTQKSQQNW